MNKPIYLDSAATTPIKQNTYRNIKPYLKEYYYNPSSSYFSAKKLMKKIEKVRNVIAQAINAESPENIIFTSGGSESNSMMMDGRIYNIIPSQYEHDSIDTNITSMEFVDSAFHGNYINQYFNFNDRTGCYEGTTSPLYFDIECMLVNNEIGSINYGLFNKLKLHNPDNKLVGCDAVQAVGHIPVDVQKLGIDVLTMSAHKFGGMKGVGAIYLSNKVKSDYESIIHGEQEHNLRGGTYNTAGIISMGVALLDSMNNLDYNMIYIRNLKEALYEGISRNTDCTLNGNIDATFSSPSILSICFNGVNAESLQMMLDTQGILVSRGSACQSHSLEESRTMKLLGKTEEQALSTIRFSLGEWNTEDEIKYVIEKVIDDVKILKSEEFNCDL